MKAHTQSIKLPIEIQGQPLFTLTISVSAETHNLSHLDSLGIGPAELPNHVKKLLQEAVDACDGSVTGLIVSNLESV